MSDPWYRRQCLTRTVMNSNGWLNFDSPKKKSLKMQWIASHSLRIQERLLSCHWKCIDAIQKYRTAIIGNSKNYNFVLVKLGKFLQIHPKQNKLKFFIDTNSALQCASHGILMFRSCVIHKHFFWILKRILLCWRVVKMKGAKKVTETSLAIIAIWKMIFDSYWACWQNSKVFRSLFIVLRIELRID